MTPQRSARPVARGARRSGARRPRCEHAPRARRAPGVPGRLCLPEREAVQGERPRERARRPARRHARPGARSPGAMDRSPTFSDRNLPLWGVTRGQDRDFLDQLQSHSTCYDRKASVLPALFSPPLSARGKTGRESHRSVHTGRLLNPNRSRKSRDLSTPPQSDGPRPDGSPQCLCARHKKSPRRRGGFHSAPNLRGPNGETPAIEGFSAIGTSVSVGARTRRLAPDRAG